MVKNNRLQQSASIDWLLTDRLDIYAEWSGVFSEDRDFRHFAGPGFSYRLSKRLQIGCGTFFGLVLKHSQKNILPLLHIISLIKILIAFVLSFKNRAGISEREEQESTNPAEKLRKYLSIDENQPINF